MSATTRIDRLEWAVLEARRPRRAGSNARLGDHGDVIRLPVLRLTTAGGASGFGPCWGGQEQAAALLGRSLEDLFDPAAGVHEAGRLAEFALWDLAGQVQAKPVYALAAAAVGRPAPAALSVPCYDTSLYFDDLHLTSTPAAAECIAAEAREGLARGHHAFKLKVGRGARHLPLAEGTERDIAVIRAVRAAVGPEAVLMLDANNGYNLNLARHVLDETADCRIYWLEEAFHEDPVLYRLLKDWLAQAGLPALIADGEGDASSHLLEWVHDGLIDVVQYDVAGHGLSAWLRTGRQLDAWGARSAPHHYGGLYGNYAACHLAAALEGFTFAEWDEAASPALDAADYRIAAGRVHVPDLPGFGLRLVEAEFQRALKNGGWELRA